MVVRDAYIVKEPCIAAIQADQRLPRDWAEQRRRLGILPRVGRSSVPKFLRAEMVKSY